MICPPVGRDRAKHAARPVTNGKIRLPSLAWQTVAGTVCVLDFRMPQVVCLFLFFCFFCPAAAAGHPRSADLPADLRVVAFLGVECPLARLAGQRLNELHAEFPQVPLEAFAPNLHDSEAAVADFQKLLDFPIRKSAAEAHRLGATHSPQVFLIHAGQVVYQGRIDDQYAPGQHRLAATRRDLALAIGEVLAGGTVSVASTEPVGCHLNLAAPEVTQASDALAILHARCAGCHHPDTAAPFRC